jgi:hypothetical protein
MRTSHVLSMRLVLVVLVALLIPVAALQAQEATEETDLGVKAVLVDGDVVSGVFEGSATAHLYAFYASAEDVVTVSMTQAEGTSLDPFIVVWNFRRMASISSLRPASSRLTTSS